MVFNNEVLEKNQDEFELMRYECPEDYCDHFIGRFTDYHGRIITTIDNDEREFVLKALNACILKMDPPPSNTYIGSDGVHAQWFFPNPINLSKLSNEEYKVLINNIKKFLDNQDFGSPEFDGLSIVEYELDEFMNRVCYPERFYKALGIESSVKERKYKK